MARTATTDRDSAREIPAVPDTWEYLIVALPPFAPASHAPGASDAVCRLNEEGEQGWEAVTMTPLSDGTIAVLFKRQVSR